ncbi:NAD(P)H-dependent glycerol-3-phosphate dehydrogenase [Bdellovibrionota bacterium FG-1]
MTQKDFWRNSKVVVIGGGSWGTVLAHLAAPHCREVRLWVREEEQARAINAKRVNEKYLPELPLHERVHAMAELDRVFGGDDGVGVVLWALPSEVCREQARRLAPFFKGHEILIHATKGVEEGSLKRVSEILREELPCPRIGVMSGPNLAPEIARGEPAATVMASVFNEVIEAGTSIWASDRLRIYSSLDVIGVEWAGALKNIVAIASGALDGMHLGWNSRAMLLTRGLAEMVRFGVAMGAREETFLGLAGMGDLLATCSSPASRNYQVGMNLAQGKVIAAVLRDLGKTAEGVRTTRNVWKYSAQHKISMPITQAVFNLIEEGVPVQRVMQALMSRPMQSERG